MKKRIDLLKNIDKTKKNKENIYINLMENVLKNKYIRELDFDEIPYIATLVWHYDFDEDIYFYTNIEKEFLETIKKTKTFKKISKELNDNGYFYELTSHHNHSSLSGRTEWRINLIIK